MDSTNLVFKWQPSKRVKAGEISYVYNLSHNQHNSSDHHESLEQLVGYRPRNRPSAVQELLPLQTGRTIDWDHIDLDEEKAAQTIRYNPLRRDI